jgi:hypothetical protein
MVSGSSMLERLKSWSGALALGAVGLFWCVVVIERSAESSWLLELIIGGTWWLYVVGVPILGFAALVLCARRFRGGVTSRTFLVVQAVLAFLSIAVWFWSIDTGVVELS